MNYEALRQALNDEDAMRAAGVIARKMVDEAAAEAKRMRERMDSNVRIAVVQAQALAAREEHHRELLYYRRIQRRWGTLRDCLRTWKLIALWHAGRRPMR